MIRVVVADDHGVLRDGLASVIAAQPGMELAGTAADGAEAVAICRSTAPDVVLMDLEMPVLDGIEATRAILEEAPGTTVLVLTSFSDRRRITGAIEAGAVGYLLKDASADEVVRGIRTAAEGGSPLDPRAARSLLEAQSAPDPLEGISRREREVLALLLDGKPNKLIARRLGISEKTVKSHLTSIFRQIGVTDRVQAILWVERHGLRGDLGPDGTKVPLRAAGRGTQTGSVIRRLASLLSVAALCAVLPIAALASGGGGEARAAGVCGKSIASELRLESDRSGIRLRFEVDHGRPGAAWRVVLVHERRIAWKGTVTARRDGSFEVRRMLRDLAGADAVSARAVGHGGLVCRAAATLAG